MQFHVTKFDPVQHDKFKALSVNQPYADYIADGSKKIEIRNTPIKYRGDLLICSTRIPVIENRQTGCTIALVDLYDCKPISELTPEEWELTRIPKEVYSQYKKKWAWFLRDNRKMIEFPVSGQQGIYNLVYTKDLIIPYPKMLPYAEPKRKR